MKSLKIHLSFIFPLFALLLSFEFSNFVKELIFKYETKTSKDYNIVLLSNKDLNFLEIKKMVDTLDSLQTLKSDEILNRIKNDISDKNMALLKLSLPKFYSLRLNSFPSEKELLKFKQKLQSINGVLRVEIFSKEHSQIYKILKLSDFITFSFVVILFLLCIMMIFKQVEIWFFTHKEQINIMELFGASFWLKSKDLYKIAIFDSIITSCLVVLIFYVFINLGFVKDYFLNLGLELPKIYLFKDILNLIAFSVFISIFCISLVVRCSLKK